MQMVLRHAKNGLKRAAAYTQKPAYFFWFICYNLAVAIGHAKEHDVWMVVLFMGLCGMWTVYFQVRLIAQVRKEEA